MNFRWRVIVTFSFVLAFLLYAFSFLTIVCVSDDSHADMVERSIDIDLVITYVNGSVPEFRNALRRHANETLLRQSIATTRFRDHDDLRYLLRSVSQFGSIFRRVFLVVADEHQIPRWLKRMHQRLTIVYHADIWTNRAQLPTFNSLAIEANLHHINELSEAYVYANDDLALLDTVAISDFIAVQHRTVSGIVVRPDPGINLRNRTTQSIREADKHWISAALNSRDLLLRVCPDVDPAHIVGLLNFPQHTPQVFLKSVLRRAEEDPAILEAFERTWASRFRSGREIHTGHFFSAYAQCAEGLSVRVGSRKEHIYTSLDLGVKDEKHYEERIGRLFVLLRKISVTPLPNEPKAKFLCLNDHTSGGEETWYGLSLEKVVNSWRKTFLPDRSEFEK